MSRRRFARIAGAGIAFQAGSAAVDSATIMSALVFQLTGSPLAVGAVPAILRVGWLAPQLFVGFLAGRGGSSLRYYAIGAFGRTGAIAALALLLFAGADWPPARLGAAVLALWAVYACVSGIVAVPYNDIVARSVPSDLRSRLLATRFFGGGVVALAVAGLANEAFRALPIPLSYAAVLAMAAGLMLLSSLVFVSAGEPKPAPSASTPERFGSYLKAGLATFRQDAAFRSFAIAQWFGAAVLMAAPFYVVAASRAGLSLDNIALLLAAQTTGAILSNLLWGWWGDRRGKLSLMRLVAALRVAPPLVALMLPALPHSATGLAGFTGLFFVLGALANGVTIGVIGLLMEISPDDARPRYSGYFNAITAPAFLLPLVGGALAAVWGLQLVFALAALAACGQLWFLRHGVVI